MTVDEIFAKFRKNSELGSGMGLTPVRASEMRSRGVIPPKYWKRLRAFAQAKGVKVTYDDLVDAHTPPEFDVPPRSAEK